MSAYPSGHERRRGRKLNDPRIGTTAGEGCRRLVVVDEDLRHGLDTLLLFEGIDLLARAKDTIVDADTRLLQRLPGAEPGRGGATNGLS